MKITVVTISFNQSQFLEKAIHSIIEQDHDDLEYIVVDPGSTDGSRDIIEKYRSRITHVVLEPDQGPSDGLNKGFSHASGEIFGFINADDALLPGALSKVSRYFEINTEIDVACGRGFIVDADDRVLKRVIPTRCSKRLFAYGAVTFMQQSTFFRKSAFLEAGGFNQRNRTSWDGELLLDMAMHDRKFGLLNADLALFRIHAASISGSGRLNEIYLKDCNRLFAKAIGRDINYSDRLLARLYRFEKLFMNPRVTLLRILSRLGGSY